MKLLWVPCLLAILVLACTVPSDTTTNPPITPVECSSDSDCMTGGCSGTLCVAKSSEPVFSTCEWREEYSCYQQTSCGCVAGKCAWDKTSEFDACIAEKRAMAESLACVTDTDCSAGMVCVESRCVRV